VRVVGAFLAALLAMGAAQGALLWQQQRVARSVAVITGAYLPLAKRVAQLERDRSRIDTDVQRILREERRPGTGDAAAALIWTTQLRDNLERGVAEAEAARALDLAPEDQAALYKAVSHLAEIQALFGHYEADSARLVEHAEAGRMAEAAALQGPLAASGTGISEEVEKLARLVDGRIEALTAAAERDRVRATAIAGGLNAAAALFAFALVGAVLYALRPVARLTEQVQRLAAGDYSGRVDVRGDDEIALLAAEFDHMVQALHRRDRALVERAEELNRLSRYLGSVLDSLEDGLFVVEDGLVTLTNPAATRVWGASRGAPPPPALAEALAAAARVDVPGPGETLHEARTSPLGADGLVVITADVTEQTAAAARLARSERLALVGQMLAQITHEVRNPLNALSLNAELLGDELSALDPERRTEAWELLDTVSGEIERLTAVTAHYLQLARRPPARLAPESIAAIVEDVVRLVDVELERQDVRLAVDVAPLPPQLVDGNQLRQALLNVLRNAVEAGGRALSLSVRAEGRGVRVALRDDGPGMTPQEAERAMDPFFSTKASGTGLGLAITKQILDDHGGSLDVRSAPGEGTEVALILPWRPADGA
jgi:signal transduction histidine kinase/HAMP domain-containing protein